MANETITDLTVTGATTTGSNNTGTLVGTQVTGRIVRCLVDGSVNGSTNTGGVVGRSGDVLEDVGATVTVDGDNIVGGITGTNETPLRRVYAHGDINGSSTVGGLVGSQPFGSIHSGYVSVTVPSVPDRGTIAGVNETDITNTYYDGDRTSADGVGDTGAHNDTTELTKRELIAIDAIRNTELDFDAHWESVPEPNTDLLDREWGFPVLDAIDRSKQLSIQNVNGSANGIRGEITLADSVVSGADIIAYNTTSNHFLGNDTTDYGGTYFISDPNPAESTTLDEVQISVDYDDGARKRGQTVTTTLRNVIGRLQFHEDGTGNGTTLSEGDRYRFINESNVDAGIEPTIETLSFSE